MSKAPEYHRGTGRAQEKLTVVMGNGQRGQCPETFNGVRRSRSILKKTKGPEGEKSNPRR